MIENYIYLVDEDWFYNMRWYTCIIRSRMEVSEPVAGGDNTELRVQDRSCQWSWEFNEILPIQWTLIPFPQAIAKSIVTKSAFFNSSHMRKYWICVQFFTFTYTEKICPVKSVELVQEFWTGSKMLEILNDF